MLRNYDNLRGGSRARLAKMRRYADDWNNNPKRSTRINWRSALAHGIGSIKSDAHGGTSGNYSAIPTSVLDGLRDIGDAADIIPSMRHTGWYADDLQDELYVGHVWQLPSRDGEECYIAGYSERDSGYTMLCASNGRLETFDDAADAARAADGLAERNAEREREYQERWRAATDLDDDISAKLAELQSIRRDWKARLAAWLDARKHGATVAAGNLTCHLSEALSDWKREAQALRDLRARLSDFADVER